ncbi:hypothetical protein FA95DRAFT_178279 [Auriscalpium vulgare]|uniref:Uncharacterized protein n=1 Tax=Auriscalpium vulgare TaxID=40419 RepID=A0ACB8RMW9_9AGAM|nr:hypothetical protein FA95DRAFT_178279 [Auriscalpium vulgare]
MLSVSRTARDCPCCASLSASLPRRIIEGPTASGSCSIEGERAVANNGRSESAARSAFLFWAGWAWIVPGVTNMIGDVGAALALPSKFMMMQRCMPNACCAGAPRWAAHIGLMHQLIHFSSRRFAFGHIRERPFILR